MYGAFLFVEPQHETWVTHALTNGMPGSHIVVLTTSPETTAHAGRVAKFELRDTFLVLSPLWTRFAFLFRLPLEAPSIVEQVLTTGTGAININACRLGEGEGRWPTNLLFVHGAACEYLGVKRVEATSIHGTSVAIRRSGVHSSVGGHQTIGREQPVRGYADEDGTEEVPFWACEPLCPVQILDHQSGDRPSTLTGRADPSVAHENPGDNGGASWFGGGNSSVYADSGGASRFYPQFKDEDDLRGWFRRLIKSGEVALYEE